MADKPQKKKLLKKLKNKYRLIIYNDKTYEEVWSVRLSQLNVFTIVGLLSIFLIILTTIIIAFTPLREYIPGYPTSEMRSNIIMNAIKVDSLEKVLTIRDKYLANIKTIIEGNEPEELKIKKDTSKKVTNVTFTKSKEDSVFRAQVEEEEKYNLSSGTQKETTDLSGLTKIHFFPPVKGLITSSFSLPENHYGVDIVASPNDAVCATLSGTIVLSSWTFETGYVVQIQHDNNLISVYKHNAKVLKKEGQKVKTGEPIAIFGNSGELTSGPHLHFELWQNGKPINPENYISFK